MDSELKGKIILITGAASGFGQAATRLLMQSGAMLALADINTQGLSAITREATAVGFTTAEFPLDVSSSEQVKTVVAAVVDRFGPDRRHAAFCRCDRHAWHRGYDRRPLNRVISINLLGTFLMVQAVSPLMKKQGGGRIVLTASDAARKGASISGRLMQPPRAA